MSVINITDITLENNPAPWAAPYKFKITFECVAQLKEDVEFALIYVGSASSEKFDQELDSCMVGPVPVGVNSFEFEAPAPAIEKIPKEELLGLAVILVTAKYNDREFVRIGYYVNTEYDTEELREDPPEEPIVERLIREVGADKPRVARYAHRWDEANEPNPSTIESNALVDAVMAKANGNLNENNTEKEGDDAEEDLMPEEYEDEPDVAPEDDKDADSSAGEMEDDPEDVEMKSRQSERRTIAASGKENVSVVDSAKSAGAGAGKASATVEASAPAGKTDVVS